MVASSKVFTHSEVSAHNTSQDCWLIINAQVYDVTSFLHDHPGGDAVLLAAAGKDASEEFEDVGHGSAARLMLDEFYVGEMDPSIKSKVEIVDATLGESNKAKDKLPQSISSKFIYIAVVLMIIVLGVGIHFLNKIA
ncbi:hypothetical protein C2S51_026902 [Perilla frutescens var. frutescens]|nr:hypothetical protein C2S51_026902 [Perilla frutescens var. frutescens]